MDSKTLNKIIGYHLRQELLPVAGESSGVRPVQERDTHPVSERDDRVRSSTNRPAIIRPGVDAGKWSTGSITHNRDGSRILFRDRSMEYVPGTSEAPSRTTPRAGVNRLAGTRTSKVFVYSIQNVQRRRAQSDSASQLSGMREAQREAEYVHGRRFTPKNQRPVELLLRQRGKRQSQQRTVRIVAMCCITFLTGYIIISLTTLPLLP